MNAVSVHTPPIRVTGLLAALALILSLTTVLAPTAGATEVAAGDSVVIPINEISPGHQPIIYTCAVDEDGNPYDCTPDHVSSPGTKAVAVRLTWSVVGQAESAAPSLTVGTPPQCGGRQGLVFNLVTQGGEGELRVQVHAEERNGATGETGEQQLADHRVPISQSGGHTGRAICNPMT